MSHNMSSNRSPPNSPRAPKIQQQSWDDCDTPPIDLFDPNVESPPRTPCSPRYELPKSPKSPRMFEKCNIKGSKKKYYEQSTTSHPRKFDFNEQRCTYEAFEYDTQSQSSSTGRRRNLPTPVKSPKSPRPFEYGAISPKFEQRSKKFEYYEPTSPEADNVDNDDNTEDESTFIDHKNSSIYFKKKQRRHTFTYDVQHQQQSSISPASQPPQPPPSVSHNKRKCSEGGISSVSGGSRSSGIGTDSRMSSLDEYTNGYGRKASVITESTNSRCCDGTESTVSGGTTTTAALCSNHSGFDGDRDTENGSITSGRSCSSRQRRLAINITSNPGYQALHNSHATLDRTCSDSIVSLRYRKSTSDLTADPGQPTPSKGRRRGSSKSGLAYLASRRGSRDSIKSAVSNTSVFSNEDIGPLAFQSSTRGRQRRTSNFLELPVADHVRPRVCSLPEGPYNPRQSDDLYRLRSFSISKGTVVNCGDSIISRRSRSNTSVNSTTSRASERSPFDGSCCGAGYADLEDSLPPSPTDSEIPPSPRYRVVLLGDSGVGKTALVSQFMTSEYMHTYDASLDDEFGEKTVSILLDGEESEMIFIDHPTVEMSVENSLSTYEPHACVVIYSVIAKSSFRVAEEILNYLWRENVTRDKAVIIVGNKADLARSRVISTAEGKQLAASRDAKFIETSSGIQHNVDELLVGILKQIRLKETREKKAQSTALKMRSSRTHMSLHLAKEILQKICMSDISKSKSCENLHVL